MKKSIQINYISGVKSCWSTYITKLGYAGVRFGDYSCVDCANFTCVSGHNHKHDTDRAKQLFAYCIYSEGNSASATWGSGNTVSQLRWGAKLWMRMRSGRKDLNRFLIHESILLVIKFTHFGESSIQDSRFTRKSGFWIYSWFFESDRA